jgi:hypothetical protein
MGLFRSLLFIERMDRVREKIEIAGAQDFQNPKLDETVN